MVVIREHRVKNCGDKKLGGVCDKELAAASTCLLPFLHYF